MSDAVFGFLVSTVAIIILVVAINVILMPDHNMLLIGWNEIYQNFASARVNMGL